MTQTDIAKRKCTDPAYGGTRSETATFVPDVDITENEDLVRVIADMPGVDKESVDVTVERNVLTIEGTTRMEAPAGYHLTGQEYTAGRFRRDFTLSDTIDASGIEARVKNGVLEVTLPKREQVKSRKIAITQ